MTYRFFFSSLNKIRALPYFNVVEIQKKILLRTPLQISKEEVVWNFFVLKVLLIPFTNLLDFFPSFFSLSFFLPISLSALIVR